MSEEHHQASEYMEKFLENLLDIKDFVKKKYEETNDEILKEIYEKLDKVIKVSR